MPPLPSSFYQQGTRRLSDEDYPGAERYLRRVVELEPTYTRAWCALGHALAGREQLESARRAWKRGPYDPDCLEALGRDLLDRDPAAAARLFRTLSTRTSADPAVDLLLARALAAADPEQAEGLIRGYVEQRTEDTPDLLPAVESVLEACSNEAALALIQLIGTRFPQLAPALAVRREEREVEARARELMGAAPDELTNEQNAALLEVRRLHAANETANALEKLERLADQAARSPEVWAALADLRESTGDIEGAERALWLARRLAPLNADVQVRHAEMLQRHFGGRYLDEAYASIRRAVQLRPTPAIRWKHARLAMLVGDLAEAAISLEALAARGPDAAEARRLLNGLQRKRADAPVLPPLPPPPGVPEEAWLQTHRAQVWWERARADHPPDPARLRRAEAEVDAALASSPDLRVALNLRAQIRWTRGNQQGAREDWTRSLQLQPDQPVVLTRLAELTRREGRSDDADALLQRAAAAGGSVALYRLAHRDASQGRWWSALGRLDAYFSRASSGRVHADALALQASLRRRLLYALLGVVAVAAMFVLGVLALWRRRRGGVSVAEWLRRDPRSFGDVARIVSAIRHEVLKHNISALPRVAEAVELGDQELLDWAELRLGTAIENLDRYVDELEGTARSQGVHLNLRQRDPTFAPFLAAIDRLRRARGRLQVFKTADELRKISTCLNQDAYAALGLVLKGVCVLQLDSALFEAAWSHVCGEVTDRVEPPILDVQCQALCVRIFRQDLIDVLINLFRNGLDASIEEGRHQLGVRVTTDEDLITGLVRAEIRVVDQVQKRLTTGMIRGRYIDRGLGLAVDLVSRAGGSMHVEAEAGWAKALVIRLPMEEA